MFHINVCPTTVYIYISRVPYSSIVNINVQIKGEKTGSPNGETIKENTDVHLNIQWDWELVTPPLKLMLKFLKENNMKYETHIRRKLNLTEIQACIWRRTDFSNNF